MRRTTRRRPSGGPYVDDDAVNKVMQECADVNDIGACAKAKAETVEVEEGKKRPTPPYFLKDVRTACANRFPDSPEQAQACLDGLGVQPNQVRVNDSRCDLHMFPDKRAACLKEAKAGVAIMWGVLGGIVIGIPLLIVMYVMIMMIKARMKSSKSKMAK